MPKPPFRSLTDAVEAYYDDLRHFVRRRTGSTSLADDVVQDTWVRASTTSAAMPENPRAYVFRMASNLAVDRLRTQGMRSEREIGGDLPDIAGSEAHSPEAAVSARQEMAILETAIKDLPPRRRLVFLLYRGRGLTMRQIADRLGISQKTVEKQIASAMVHCRQRLRATGRSV